MSVPLGIVALLSPVALLATVLWAAHHDEQVNPLFAYLCAAWLGIFGVLAFIL